MLKLTDGELIAKVEAYEQNSYGIFDAALVEQRKKALDYYNGQPFGNEIDGRSQVVSRDVLDTIESALPQLMKPFVSGDEVVRFMPRGPEDEQAAEQESAAVNYYVMDKNDWFRVLYTWQKDALLSKNGYVKVYWEEENDTEIERYQGLTDDQLSMLVNSENIEVLEHTSYPDPVFLQHMQGANAAQMMQAGAPMQSPPMIHDVKIKVTETKGCIEIENVSPEDILVGFDTRSVSLCEASFVQHRALMTEDEIAENGWEIPAGAQMGTDAQMWEEQNSRDLYDENAQTNNFAGQYLVKDTYMKVGGELNRLVIIANTIVFKDDEDVIIPFVAMTPHIMPHRHIGMSYSDLTEDIQLIKSTLLRGQLDAMYLANQPRFGISDRVNLEDMLTSRPGGVVRVSGDPAGNIMPLVTPSFPQTSFQLVEYLDSAKERRTGVTAYNQGLDANSLNKTATGVSQIMQATQQRIELVARTFAVSIKELFTLVHRLIRKYNTRPDIIQIRNEWVNIDPREWKERKDMTIAVGLGTGNKDQQLMHLQAMWQRGMASLQAGLPTVSPENMYEIERQLAINSGFKRPEQFVTDPKTVPPKPPQQDPKMAMEQMKLQAEQQKFQAETIIQKAKDEHQAQLDMQKFRAQAEIVQRQAEQNWQQEQLRSANDVAIERQKIAAQMELERYKAELDAQTKLQIAQLQIEAEKTRMVHESMQKAHDSEMQQKMHQEKIAAMTRPKTITKDANGRPSGVQ